MKLQIARIENAAFGQQELRKSQEQGFQYECPCGELYKSFDAAKSCRKCRVYLNEFNPATSTVTKWITFKNWDLIEMREAESQLRKVNAEMILIETMIVNCQALYGLRPNDLYLIDMINELNTSLDELLIEAEEIEAGL